jgi:hypothetical protein
MFIPKPTEGGDFSPAPAGTHIARCYRFVDLGTHMNEFNGEKKTRHEVLISWELSDEFMDDGKPFTINKRYTWSMHEKSTLRHHLEAWRKKEFGPEDFDGPNPFDTKNIVGKPCTLTIVNQAKPDGKIVAKVSSVGPMIKGVEARELVNAPVYLALTDDRWNAEVYAGLGEYYKALIAESPEYKDMMQKFRRPDDPVGSAYAPLSDDIPFAPEWR